MTAQVDFNGKLTVLKTFENWPSTWEVYSTLNGLIIFYDPGVGLMIIQRIDENGDMVDVNYYEPE